METVHSVGLGAFVFVVAPSYDPAMVIMLSQFVGIVPTVLRLRQVKRPIEPGEEEVQLSLLFLSSSSSLSLFFLFFLMEVKKELNTVLR